MTILNVFPREEIYNTFNKLFSKSRSLRIFHKLSCLFIIFFICLFLFFIDALALLEQLSERTYSMRKRIVKIEEFFP